MYELISKCCIVCVFLFNTLHFASVCYSGLHTDIHMHTLKTLSLQPALGFWRILACTWDWWKLLSEHFFPLIPVKEHVHSGDIWSELGKLMKRLINWNSSHQSLEPSVASFTFQTISWWSNRTLAINMQESMWYCHVTKNTYWILSCSNFICLGILTTMLI